MRQLLFDQNLSPKLVDRLTDVYPNSVHVRVSREVGSVRSSGVESPAHPVYLVRCHPHHQSQAIHKSEGL